MARHDSDALQLGGPRIGVVVPTLNEGATILSCLDSIGEGPELDVVVSDGGSSDRTCELAASREGVKVVRSAAGRGGQLNRGAAAVGGDLLLFLHGDCRLPAGWAEAVSTALSDPCTALSCFRLHTEPSDASAGRWRRRWLRLVDLRSLGLGLPYGDQAFGIRRQLFDELGGFADLPLMEDLELARRCKLRGRIVRLPLEVRTTARRFERHPVRTRLMTAVFPSLFRCGVPAATLARWYREVR
ncbi:MAG: TIGR04283 family arsenosugar biosynthesis glycosyltransferase [Acidobacteria bacterium]|nr:TIGR04283 family arsenosugar biosynthesis glycosyltransferase [Acidobacteriota bacterium]